MCSDPSITSACQCEVRLRHQRARIEQRHVQFGRRGRLDVGRLLLRAAPIRVAPLVEVRAEHENIARAPMRQSTLATTAHRLPLEADGPEDGLEPSLSSTATPSTRLGQRRRVPGTATLGDFVATDRVGAFPYREWVATLADRTEVVVSDWCAAPSLPGIEKAVSIVQSRAYLEQRARLLLRPFGKNDAGSWRLTAIDFGTAARRHRCEFLMCFAVQDTSGALSMTSPFVEIGFTLPTPVATDPVFVLTIVTAVGFAA